MKNHQSNCNSIVRLCSDFASYYSFCNTIIDRVRSTDPVVQVIVSIDFASEQHVCMDKQLSLLCGWHLLNVRHARYFFSTTLLGINSNCDVINVL